MSTEKDNQSGNFTVTRRDFLKIAGVAAVAAGAAFLVSPEGKLALNMFALSPDYEQLQPGWLYSYMPNICTMCSSTCDLLVNVENNGSYIRANEIDGNPISNLNFGKICPRGRTGLMLTYSKDRLKKPLIRTGPKGTWSFKEATWQEAIQYILNQMQSLGVQPWEVALSGGQLACANYRPQLIPFMFGTSMPNMAGSPMQPCIFGEHLGMNLTVGTFDIHGDDLMDDFNNSSLIVLWGSNGNPAGIFVNRGARFGQALANNAYVIVVDPRQSEAASKADLWVPVKPGSDLYLAMAIINYIISNEYYDSEFVRYYSNASFLVYEENGVYKPLTDEYENGNVKSFYVYDEYSGTPVQVPPYTNSNAKSVTGATIRPALSVPAGLTVNGKQVITAFQVLSNRVSSFTLNNAASVSGVDISVLNEMASRIATTRPMDIATGLKSQWGSYSTQLRKAIATIMVLTGNIDVKGGWIYSGAYREDDEGFYSAYQSAASSGTILPGMLLQMPDFLSTVPTLKLPGLILQMFATIYAFNNPSAWPHGYPAVDYALSQNLKAQGLKPAAAFSTFPDTGVYEATKGQVTWNGQPYNIKMVFAYGVNPAKDMQSDEWKEILSNTFVVMIDILPTDTALYADVILPDTTYLERDEYIMTDSAAEDLAYRARLQVIPRVFPGVAVGLDLFIMLAYAMGESVGDSYVQTIAQMNGFPVDQFMSAVKSKLSYYMDYLINNDSYPEWGSLTWDSWSQVQSQLLAPKLGVTPDQLLEQIRSNGVVTVKTVDEFFSDGERIPWDIPIATPTGRAEIYSTVLYYYVIKEYGYDDTWDPILKYVPPNWNGGYTQKIGTFQQPPSQYADPSFQPTPPEAFYIEYKIPYFAYTFTTDNPILMAISQYSYHENINQMIWMNPSFASAIGVTEGDWVAVISKLSGHKLIAKAHLTEWIRPDTVGVPEPYGQVSPGLTYSLKALKNFGNEPVTHIWTQSYDPLTGHRMSEQQTVTVRLATKDEVQAATTIATDSTPTTLPAQSTESPLQSISSSDWASRYGSYLDGGE